MCTVTYIPTRTGIRLTSNRDERPTRSQAVRPKKYSRSEGVWIYPKDRDKGGSWIGVKDNGDAAVLLNGAFTGHQRQAAYRKSRGLVFLEIAGSDHPLSRFEETDLTGIEPFTIILYSSEKLWDCRWDGREKHRRLLDPACPYIWSSATLYGEPAREQRKQWFDDWRNVAGEPTKEKILSFHRYTGADDPKNGLVIDRPGAASTVSITSIGLSREKAEILYLDLKQSRQYSEQLDLVSQTKNKMTQKRSNVKQWVNKLVQWMDKPIQQVRGSRQMPDGLKQFLIKWLHWEYWPFHIVYAPLYPYWLWLGLKARSFFFFSAANPSIRNAGFLLENKKAIYDLMPEGSFPKTVFCRKGTAIKTVLELAETQKLVFPLIAKPDIGERGVQVRLLKTAADLEDYERCSKVDFLLQEYIDYPMEAGIFYYRIPGEIQGHISGIVGKEFLSVCGDGISTLEQLLQKEDRFVLQLSVLRRTYGAFLQTVPPRGATHTLVPYGNHSRGAKFTDQSQRIDEDLRQTIDGLCRQVDGFYFGRLDIKFRNWEELSKGKHFSVIEINGAGSEPTHIYDPGHSIFFAWKEIRKHWKLLYKISRLNASRQQIPLMGIQAGFKMLRDHANHLKLLS